MMQWTHATLAGAVATFLLAVGLSATNAQVPPRQPSEAQSAMLFMQMMPVLSSPRCMNCHTATDFPRQGDERRRHRMLIVRGPDNHGVGSLQCQACHLAKNSAETGVPGAPDWHIAPLSMNWEGLTPGQLCRVILDPEPMETHAPAIDTMVAHMETPLVQWAWSPGVNLSGRQRTKPPMSSESFLRLTRAWVASGAHCPSP